MNTTGDRFGAKPNTTEAFGNAASSAIAQAGDQLADAASQAQTMAHDQIDKLSASIRSKPIQAAGIAAGIGFVLALLARR